MARFVTCVKNTRVDLIYELPWSVEMTVTNVCVTLVRSCEIFKSPESKFDQV